jgi:hypothetical protein
MQRLELVVGRLVDGSEAVSDVAADLSGLGT